MRTAVVTRTTAETDIALKLKLDGLGVAQIDTGVGFLDHMLNLFAAHGRFDLAVTCKGDTNVDDHHSVEDVGIALGMALKEALAEKRGVRRYGSMLLPMARSISRAAPACDTRWRFRPRRSARSTPSWWRSFSRPSAARRG